MVTRNNLHGLEVSSGKVLYQVKNQLYGAGHRIRPDSPKAHMNRPPQSFRCDCFRPSRSRRQRCSRHPQCNSAAGFRRRSLAATPFVERIHRCHRPASELSAERRAVRKTRPNAWSPFRHIASRGHGRHQEAVAEGRTHEGRPRSS